MAVFDAAIALASTDSEAALHMSGTRAFLAAWWGEEPNRAERQRGLHRRAVNLAGDTVAERQVLAAARVTGLMAGLVSADEAMKRTRRISRTTIEWADREGDVSQGASAFAQLVCDAPTAADLFEKRAIPQCIREGRTVDLGFAQTCLAIIRLRHGALVDGEATARTAWQLMRTVGESAAVVYWWSAAALIDILIARGKLDTAAALFEQTGFDKSAPTVVIFPWPVALRGELALARGDTAEGVQILLDAGRWLEERGFLTPPTFPGAPGWRRRWPCWDAAKRRRS